MFYFQITVWSGPCGSLSCVDGNDDGCSPGGGGDDVFVDDFVDDGVSSLSSSASWTSTYLTEYYIFVHGYGGDSLLGQTGDFGLTVTAGLASAEQGCLSATNIDVGGYYQGSTTGQTIFPANECNETGFESAGVWYRLLGTGDIITVDTCDSYTNFDTVVSAWQWNPRVMNWVWHLCNSMAG